MTTMKFIAWPKPRQLLRFVRGEVLAACTSMSISILWSDGESSRVWTCKERKRGGGFYERYCLLLMTQVDV